MKISVCVPVYNGAHCLGQALQSLREQTRQPDEVIVVDDGSGDSSRDVIEFFKDLPIQYFRNETNLGMVRNWNACLSRTTGEIVTFLHQDDGYYDRFLATVERDFSAHPNVGLWACVQAHRDNPAEACEPPFIGMATPEAIKGRFFTWRFIPPPTAAAFRSSSLREVGFYDEQYRYVAEPDLYFRLSNNRKDFFQCGDLLVWRTAPDTRATETMGNRALYYREWAYFLNKFKGAFPPEQHRELLAESLRNLSDHAAVSVTMRVSKREFKAASELLRTLQGEVRTVAADSGLWFSVYSPAFALGFAKAFLGQGKRFVRRMLGKLRSYWLRYKKMSATKPDYVQRGRFLQQELRTALESGASSPKRERLRAFLNEMTLFDFYSHYLNGPHYHMPWQGTEMTKLPMDAWIYSDLMYRCEPEYLIEIGTQRGTSALMLQELGRGVGVKVITVDILTPPAERLQEFLVAGVQFVHGNATEAATIERIRRLTGGSKNCMVIDDGSHLVKDVLGTFRLLAGFVAPGGAYVVEDGFANWLLGNEECNALAAVDQIVKEQPEFARNPDYDSFFLFSAFDGILRKERL
jgi:cephalosporin hydroxylase/cellulose synthase/poly-beta-1,6-N-acetylglucosamine synthase-like glycosyltransferase